MNELRETIGAGTSAPSGTGGHHGDAPKKAYAPPRVQLLMDTSRDTGNGQAGRIAPESICESMSPGS